MSLLNLLRQRREGILDKWTDSVVATYEPRARAHLKNQRDRFLNPVGHTMKENLACIYDRLLDSGDHDGKLPIELIKIRAVQDFDPSRALGFIFQLKKIISEELAVDLEDHETRKEYARISEKIDEIALNCFDIYMECREQLGRIKINEFKRRYQKLLDRACLLESNDIQDEV